MILGEAIELVETVCQRTQGEWKRIAHLLGPDDKSADIEAMAFQKILAVARTFPKMLESLGRACESIDAGETDHDPSCAQEQDNVVAAHEENRPLADCSCWVSGARDALRAAREAVKP